jgi:hypothetical protein
MIKVHQHRYGFAQDMDFKPATKTMEEQTHRIHGAGI